MFLYGASGHAKVIIDSLKAMGVSISGLFDDNPVVKSLLEFPVFGAFDADRLGGDSLIVSVGVNSIRKKIVDKLPIDISYGMAIHPSAIVSEYASVDKGSVVMQGAIIQASSVVGKHCIINTGASVDHDCNIADFVHISPHATLCGDVTVGEGSWIAAGATIIPGVKIGKWCVIGAGSVVTKDIPDYSLAAGNRCKIIKKINEQ
jgi:sugar O-acyltransferase (sialic acid O-acetyltransferase NeuD family)